MPHLDLFPREQVIGVFRGFREGGLEFHADLALPYRSDFQNTPMHGQFLLVQLETPWEAVLGRIASLSSEGKLSVGAGEEFAIRAMQDHRPIPEDLRQQYLKYRVDIRVLGVVRSNASGGVTFVPSHRRLPHVGSLVAFPSDKVLREIVGHTSPGAPIGHFALGEYLYATDAERTQATEWMQMRSPEVLVRFPIHNLVARRTFVFARAGFGKSNLNKLLFAKLYEETPTVTKRNGRQVPVGTVLFDPDGEYFWPDDRGRPGLCDVPALQDRLVVFTNRRGPSRFYDSFVAGGIRLDLRRFRPTDVIAIALGAERQDQQNVRKLRELNQDKWTQLVDLIDRDGNQADLTVLGRLLDLDPKKQELESLAARANMTAIVRTLHNHSSQLMDLLLEALSQGKLCVVDVSQLRGSQALMLSSLVLRRIFDRNQEEFTAAEPRTIPTIAVVEEAQSVLRDDSPACEPYIAWVKEGRKYDLGAVLITQQPGSIPPEILSQGDNWFLFHLLSAGDLLNVKRANAHFSEDLLGALLNEPIPGQGVFWSSVGGRPFPVAFRALSFEDSYTARDPRYDSPEVKTYARSLRDCFTQSVKTALAAGPSGALEPISAPGASEPMEEEDSGGNVDVLALHKSRAILALKSDAQVMNLLRGDGVKWGRLVFALEDALPATLDDRHGLAANLVREALVAILGPADQAWVTCKDFAGKTIVRAKPPSAGTKPR
jgi:hypothetical protein